MTIDSKIQMFKMYQTFGDRIPSFLYSRYLFLPNGYFDGGYEMRSIKELTKIFGKT